MKYLFFVFTAAALVSACTGSDASGKQGIGSAAQVGASNPLGDTATFTSLQWLDSTYQDIGNVKKGVVADISWRSKNAGTKPLVIVQVSPGCGCTVAEKPEAPIMPGEESVIRAKFNSSGQHEGEHRKQLVVMANAKEATEQQLTFRVQVTN